MPLRKIVRIDREKCNGCGQCIPNCAEGALALVDGKATIVQDSYCDGLGACLGECPTGAISIIERQAPSFDEEAAVQHVAQLQDTHRNQDAGRATDLPARTACSTAALPAGRSGCPGMRAMEFQHKEPPADDGPAPHPNTAHGAVRSALGHWPIQLALLPLEAPFFRDRELVIAADCTAFALPQLNPELLAGRALAIFCPKLDDTRPYAEKLTEILRRNTIRGLVLVHMEVPCCGGIVALAHQAAEQCGRLLPVRDITVGCRGEIMADQLAVVGG
ncbi:MAG: ferredoxin [Anaerolineaceae bacterium]|nr:ferredoxin [Anaerolineaceae bacterium]